MPIPCQDTEKSQTAAETRNRLRARSKTAAKAFFWKSGARVLPKNQRRGCFNIVIEMRTRRPRGNVDIISVADVVDEATLKRKRSLFRYWRHKCEVLTSSGDPLGRDTWVG